MANKNVATFLDQLTLLIAMYAVDHSHGWTPIRNQILQASKDGLATEISEKLQSLLPIQGGK